MSAYAPRLGAHLVVVATGLAAAAALALGFLMTSPPGSGSAGSEPNSARADRSYGELPLAFEPNAGRYDARVGFTAKAQSGSVALTDRGAVLSQTTDLGGGRGASVGASAVAGDPARSVTDAIAIRFPGADLSSATATDKLPGVVNDLRGDDPSRHVTGISTFAGVTYSSVKPGVDLDFYGKGTALEYDFRLAPGVDPSVATTRIAGADDLHLNAAGDLVATVGKTRFVQNAPVSFQPATATEPKTAVESRFVLDGDRVAFALGDYDPSRALVIDPVQLSYSTYLGGGDFDQASAVAVDSGGRAYLTGDTGSSDFDIVNPVESDSAGSDVFVSKLSSDGDELEYSTYLGGGDSERALDIAVDSGGSVYVTGDTFSADFNTVGAYEGASGSADAFVSKLTPDGDALAYSTYIGGTDADTGRGIAVDSSGAATIAGSTSSTDFDTVDPIEGDSGDQDAFVTKVDPSGDQLVYSSYLGGADSDSAEAIALDPSGFAYVAGATDSTDFDTLGGIEANSADRDAFVSKLAPSDGALSYSTYLGGSGRDVANGIAVDSGGAAYVIGDTESTDFDTVDAIETDSGDGASDAFVSKLTPPGGALSYSTYLGGGGVDFGLDVAVDASGTATVAGFTFSSDFDLVEPIEGGGGGGSGDAFVSRLEKDGQDLIYSTPLGGSGFEQANAVALDPSGGAYIAGYTSSSDFPTVDPVDGDSGQTDVFVSKLELEQVPPETTITGKPAKTIKTKRRSARVTFRFVSSDPDATFGCSIDAKPFRDCASPKAYNVGFGKHSFRVRAANAADQTDPKPASYSFTVKKKRKRRG